MRTELVLIVLFVGAAMPAANAQTKELSPTAPDLSHVSQSQCKAGYAPSYGISREQFDSLCQRYIGMTPPSSGAASGAITAPEGGAGGSASGDAIGGSRTPSN